MNTEQPPSTEEVAFSLAIATSALLTLLNSIKFFAAAKGQEFPLEQEKLVQDLDKFMEMTASMAGKERIQTGAAKSKLVLDEILRLSRPDNSRMNS